MKYVLKITSFGGIVPGAYHFRGRVEGEFPRSCHGGTSYNAPEHRGKTTCELGHEIPKQIEWDIEASWSEERYDRWAAGHYEDDGPSQFTDKDELIKTAIARFKNEFPHPWYEEDYPIPQKGDQLYIGWIPVGLEGENDMIEEDWGKLLVEIQ